MERVKQVMAGMKSRVRVGMVWITSVALLSSASLSAQPSMNDYSAVPPLSLLTRGNPMIMLTLSADHQLFFKAYNDYDDLDGDGLPNTTYHPSFDYLGYFDHHKCYVYNSAQTRFEISPNPPTDAALQYCQSSEWSGNFLNWLTMTRMDLVRSVLYGGYRVVDTADLTVLERAWLPHDAHSFAKFYNGSDAARLMDVGVLEDRESCSTSDPACVGYTFCNTSRPTGVGVFSQEAAARNQPPLLRVVKGNYQFWSNSERFQCLYGPTHASTGSELTVIGTDQEGDNGNDPAVTGVHAFATSPAAAQGADLLVRVVACGANSEGGTHSCKSYGTSSKPVGVLQEYGENAAASVKFGLLTGGYNSNKTFGNLRKNIGSMADEIDPATGVFRRDSTIDSIVNNLDALQIVDYLYKDSGGDNTMHGTYRRPNPSNGMVCNWGMNSGSFFDGNCRNWGNPFSELLAESYRYYAGASAAKGASDASLLPGLTVAPWRDPLADDERKECVDMNVIGFNSSTVSYDGELFSQKLSDLGLPVTGDDATVATLVQRIGQREVDATSSYFVGQTAAVSNGLCTPKSVTDLSEVRGTCPESPGLGGGYAGAGLAHYVYTNDVRPELNGKNTVRTFGVTLAGNLPKITVKVPGDSGREITILPACRNSSISGNGNCAIVDFKPLQVTDTSGSYFVSWEDSEQGGDFDVDMNGIIRYTLTGSRITVETRIIYTSTPDALGFGFVISGTGTTADNFYILSGVNGFQAPAYGCGANCTGSQWRQQAFTISATGGVNVAARFLESPLYYAAKWGSFTDLTTGAGSQAGIPDDVREWDQNGDGQPDGYFLVSNPAQLKTQMENTINGILYRVSAGTGASLSVSNTNGDGLFLQSLYRGEASDGARKVNWVGTLNGLFMDRNGHLREDTDGNGRLTQADRIVEIYYDEDKDDTFVNRYEVGPNGQPLENENTRRGLELDAILPIWNARDQLGSLTNAQILSQRSPYLGVGRGRYLFTGVDQGGAAPADGQIASSEVVAFTEASLASHADLAALLDTDSAESAQQVLRFTRGEEGIAGFRSRSLNLDNDTALEKWLLGDIMHSTAAIVGSPSGRYDLNYGDDSYRAFRDHYARRRQVVYVGANDGMLHAFNAGFFDAETRAYATALEGTGGLPLGDELWGYVPYNLLPHLKWLTRADYNHVYYVDSNVQVYDVNIFDADDDHPHGWGTILVVGMRFGGGDYPVTVTSGDERTLRSAYVIMDVTNPEKPPRLLAEVTDEAMGFTLGLPDLVKFRQPASDGSYRSETTRNEWHLVFGSGPRGAAALSSAVSDQPAQLFSLDLVRLEQRGEVELRAFDLEEPHAFVGSLRSVDWNRDYLDDGLYFGIVGDGIDRDEEKTRGGLKQVVLRSTGSGIFDSANDLLDADDFDLPFMVRPLAVNDTRGNYWIFAGSGRFLSAADLAASGEHFYFGIKVNAAGGLSQNAVAADELFESSAHKVYLAEDGSTLVETDLGDEIGSVDDTNALIDELSGWYREFRPRESTFSLPAFFSGTLVVNGYTPPEEEGCRAEGTTRQYVLDMFNGMPQSRLQTGFYDGSTVTRGDQTYRGLDEVGNVIDGLASDNVVVNGTVTVLTEHSNPVKLEIKPSPPKAHRRSWREVPLDEVDL